MNLAILIVTILLGSLFWLIYQQWISGAPASVGMGVVQLAVCCLIGYVVLRFMGGVFRFFWSGMVFVVPVLLKGILIVIVLFLLFQIILKK